MRPYGSLAMSGDDLDHERLHRLVEATTMALYVAIALLAALAVLDPERFSAGETIGLVWGTALGLAIAHYVAFRLASHLALGRSLTRQDAEVAGLQVAGALTMPVACTITVLLFGRDGTAIDVAIWTVGLGLGAAGFLAGRANGASLVRSAILGGGVLVIGILTATAKVALGGH